MPAWITNSFWVLLSDLIHFLSFRAFDASGNHMFGQWKLAVPPYKSLFPWLSVVTVSGREVTSHCEKTLFPAHCQETFPAGLLCTVSQLASISWAPCTSRHAANASLVRRFGEHRGMLSVHSPFHQFKQVLISVNYLCEQWERPPQVQSNLFEVCYQTAGHCWMGEGSTLDRSYDVLGTGVLGLRMQMSSWWNTLEREKGNPASQMV